MPQNLTAQEAQQILTQFYPTETSNIHGRLYASRVSALMPNLVDFFKANIAMVPEELRDELNKLTPEDLINWQRVAMLRASGRFNKADGSFQDFDSGSKFADQSERYCKQYLQEKGVPNADGLAHAIYEADKMKPNEKKSLLGWVLQHATTLETLRDRKNKNINIKMLPAWEQAKSSPELTQRLTTLAVSHYGLIARHQGFACVALQDASGQKIYPPQIDDARTSPKLAAGKQHIKEVGESPSCYTMVSDNVNQYYNHPEVKSRHMDLGAPPTTPVQGATISPAPPRNQSTTSSFSTGGTAPIKGGLIPFQVDFEKQGAPLSTRAQAITILDEVARLHAMGAKKVGITYSANQAQSENILQVYNQGGWKTGTTGSNQAAVIEEIEKLLTERKYMHLQDVYRTVPITTMKYADPEAVQQSLQQATQFIEDGGVLLGWRNQLTPKDQLAIGGGVAKSVQPLAQKQMIADWVQTHLQQAHLTATHSTAPTPIAQSAQSVPVEAKSEKSILANVIKDYDAQFKIPNTENYKPGYAKPEIIPSPASSQSVKLNFPNKEKATNFFIEQAEKGGTFELKVNGIVVAIAKDKKLFDTTGNELKRDEPLPQPKPHDTMREQIHDLRESATKQPASLPAESDDRSRTLH
ncbi:hypothetical protein Lade_1416 [Legionella adelaidensis]|uniref:Dot/Icm secretion system substrate n=1 Tax=Legionella adelaidensis TaxID=45056 RepID=A0A0W0R2A7_9GAMM|nr:hypothetical protein [Legionella adelaidensis]KTC65233.1 hypothetical protein Lade_1416 [Legionella adelaidensis]